MSHYDTLKSSLLASPKTWMITGVAGFIGSNLLESLLKLNQRVVGLDNFATGYRENLDDVQSRVTPEQWTQFNFIQCDIRNLETCKTACEGVDYVFHQAAMASVPISIEDPITSNAVNVSGFLNMLVAARDAGVEKFVYASSCAVYGDDPELPKIETMLGRALSPYAATKYMNELYAGVFALNYDLNCVGLRYFNIFGPRQDPNGAYAAVIPLWVTAMIQDKEIYIHGDGETTRDFCFVDNCVQANILAACNVNGRSSNTVYNVGNGSSTSLNELFNLIRDEVVLLNPRAETIKPVYRDFRAGDIRHSQADILKVKNLLCYEPNYSVKAGIEKAAQWYVNNS